MEFLVNDLSIHAQFEDVSTFRSAIGRVMEVRRIARRFGRELYCHRNIANAQVTDAMSLPQALGELSREDRRALMQWLTRQGPFWDDTRLHGPDDYLECNEAVVTDSAVGEAAYCCLRGIERHLVSLTPSRWQISPVLVSWIAESSVTRFAQVANHWEPRDVAAALELAPAPLASWADLEALVIVRCPMLVFAADAFAPLRGHPFASGAAKRIQVLLETLNRFVGCFDEYGQRTPEGHRLYQDHFTGDNAAFSDSSDAEKSAFRAELTFQHPNDDRVALMCTWHGKVKTGQLRIHFSWPVRANEPLYVVYVGPKITKR